MHILKNMGTFMHVIHSFSMNSDIFFDKSALKVRLKCVSDFLNMIFEFSIKFWMYSEKFGHFYVCYP